jgi:cytochrome P450
MLHDPETFPEPNRFNPERWLAPGAPTFPDAAFGFGRRECPGRFMARESVWAAIAGVLAAFEILPVEDDPPKELYTSGIVACVISILSWKVCSAAIIEFSLAILNRSSAWCALARRHT